MDITAFRSSLAQERPPEGTGRAVQALWYQAKGNWDRAHQYAQAETEPDGAWVHAFLHRVEGDNANAGYWYRRAGKPHSRAPLNEEWEEIAAALLARDS